MEGRLSALGLALVVVLTGCMGYAVPTAPADGETTDVAGDAPTTVPTGEVHTSTTASAVTASGSADAATADAPQTTRPDPEEDTIGWENGYWYDDDLSVTQSDGLNESELEAVVARTMARVEYIRQEEFTSEVPVEVISRAEYRDRRTFSYPEDPWQDQFWEAAFVLNESQAYDEEVNELFASAVAGFYSPSEDRIVLVSPTPDSLELDRTTLAHELVHALQDQQLSLGSTASNRDAAAARTAVTEGDANYVMDRYEERCGEEWSCIDRPERDGASLSERGIDAGLYASIWVPYSDGPTFIGALRDRDGWEAVNDAYTEPPVSTEQIIHPSAYPDDTPSRVDIADRSWDDWRVVYPRFGSGAAGTMGEATLFVMLWENGVIPDDHVSTDERRWNYSHPATTGWDGDAVVAYTNGEEYGYVFKSTWDSEEDAEEFHEAYLELLRSKGGEEVEDGVYVLPEESGYGDAFRVELRGDTVLVVNAPTVDELDAVHAPEE